MAQRIILSVFGILISFSLSAQVNPVAKSEIRHPKDSTKTSGAPNVLEAFRHGHFNGHFRSFFMATDNAEGLSDYYALAAGGGLHFETAPWRGWSMGIGGVFHYNLASSDLGVKDSLTGASNRYEIGLFDVENPYNKNDLDRLETFYLRYERKKTRVTLGKQALQTPFVNYQDGRMRPTAELGVWAENESIKNAKIEGGWLWGISPRSTVGWYDIGESIGLYPKGLNPDGTASGYDQNLTSAGIAILGVTYRPGKHLKIQLWDHFVENIFNTAMIQTDWTFPINTDDQLLAGIAYIRQDAVAAGGNEDQTKAYCLKGAQSNIWSAQMGWKKAKWQITGAYSRVTDDGRFLFPREWGRESLYTFMPRERVEGSGDSHSATLRGLWKPLKKLSFGAAYGHFYLPDVKNAAMNKYAFPSFRQMNVDLNYQFGGVFKGLRAQVLYVWKGRIGETYDNPKYLINKVNLSHYNIILNYTY